MESIQPVEGYSYVREVALAYLRQGLRPIPLQLGTKDQLAIQTWREFQTRPPTEDEVSDWFVHDRNIGVLTGAAAGLVVVDVDDPEAERYVRERGVPPTFTYPTRAGRRQFWFDPQGRKVPTLNMRHGPQKLELDIKGEGGYVVAPPSVVFHHDEHDELYHVNYVPDDPDAPLAPLPDWVPELADEASSGGQVDVGTLWRGVDDGTRHTDAARLAGILFAAGASPGDAAELLLAWDTRNRPPVGRSDILRTVNSIGRRDAAQREAREGFTLVKFDWLSDENEPEHAPIFPPFIDEPGRRVLFYGATGSMKSLMAAHIGGELSRMGTRVVLFSGENPVKEERRRLQALDANPDFLTVYGRQGLDLMYPDHRRAVLDVARDAEVVIIDTLTACWSGDENENAAIAALDRNLLIPISDRGTCTVLIHHTGHEGGTSTRPRGASSIEQKADASFMFTKEVPGSSFFVDQKKTRTAHFAERMVLKIVELPGGGLTIRTVGGGPSNEAAELADAMAAVIREKGKIASTELKERVGGQRASHPAAMRLLREESPPRVVATKESIETRGGRQQAMVWRPVEVEHENEDQGGPQSRTPLSGTSLNQGKREGGSEIVGTPLTDGVAVGRGLLADPPERPITSTEELQALVARLSKEGRRAAAGSTEAIVHPVR